MQMAPQGRLLAMADQTRSPGLPIQGSKASTILHVTMARMLAEGLQGRQVLLTGAAAASMTSHRIVEEQPRGLKTGRSCLPTATMFDTCH
jgi:hypothetical protein